MHAHQPLTLELHCNLLAHHKTSIRAPSLCSGTRDRSIVILGAVLFLVRQRSKLYGWRERQHFVVHIRPSLVGRNILDTLIQSCTCQLFVLIDAGADMGKSDETVRNSFPLLPEYPRQRSRSTDGCGCLADTLGNNSDTNCPSANWDESHLRYIEW